ncbi:hypothetical protein SLH46_13685 [Draconibacterium sp. IB214405]|uniref:hypothetical protein n=1 Tax=Draconibacterium sp. IB214405 TaxID=3097352 RepID=UPI002A14C584|nr:hypothetical protein [Draconibacterium sp. IB214405]MDX8340246.1 hypothetical protein [Draconibacterium sp. IB214405]
MSNLKIHIALVFLGIFVFPIAYQPYHIVRHHSEKADCHHECCHLVHDEPDGVTFKDNSGEEESCPICDYHFPVKDLPKPLFFTAAIPIVQNSLVEIEIKRACKQVISTKTPRAPPVC